MLQGTLVMLRARVDADVPVLHSELYDDVPTRSRADNRAWRPLPLSASPYGVADRGDGVAEFSIVERVTDELAGEAVLWSIDRHNRSAHIGISLRPAFRGRGLGSDVLRVLTHYGLATLGLNRLQLETGSDNAAMLAAAARAGYQQDGTLRQATWADGAFRDQVVMSVLAAD